ncbi:MAG: hypothetical protein DMF86_00500 [Acidobacteria bacterium]|nr:MAG: hypothetical protein DMF86_00500 [Acidobacteriota bacterium]
MSTCDFRSSIKDAGNRAISTADFRLAIGDSRQCRLPIVDWIVDWRLAIGDWRLVANSRQCRFVNRQSPIANS